MWSQFKAFLFGSAIDPLAPGARHRVALVALIAWVGLGADALSSSCYGPEQAYVALSANSHLAVFVALLTVLTIFVISVGYNQVIELFPGGGGGYKIASRLLHPYAGVVSGAALVIDYVLTIAVSIASGTDAVFSFLPLSFGAYKLYVAIAVIFSLLALNMRGMKEAIYVMLPVFAGFILTHAVLIIYGILAHAEGLAIVIPATISETHHLAMALGVFPVIGLVLHAFSLGSGTYTGLEAVSNNVQRLAEPRVQTGKRTMLYMAISLSFLAGGLILLYLLWEAQPTAGQTLNATVFGSILGDSWIGHSMLIFVLQLEAGLLIIAANSGFIAGPNVLANMAVDGWMPNQFRYLSSRLVVQNGMILFGVSAVMMLIVTGGSVSMLVVLYSINVFITFTLSLLGVTVFWVRHRTSRAWGWHASYSAFACFLTASILGITLYYKFSGGGWLTLLLTAILVSICGLIKYHYQYVARKLADLEQDIAKPVVDNEQVPYVINPQLPTAIIFVNNLSVGMHTLLSVLRLFPGQFKNFIFLGAGEVDSHSFRGGRELEAMQKRVNKTLDYFVRYCRQYQIPAESYAVFGTDIIGELEDLADEVANKYPSGIFFSSHLVFANENVFTRALHSHTPLILQHHLHFRGRELMILPMRL